MTAGGASRVDLTILVDNSAGDDRLRAEHGLSLLIRGGQRQYLFDAACSADALSHNAAVLDVDLHRLDGVILSHGHYDHTGGLSALAGSDRALSVFATHRNAFGRRWSAKPGQPLKDVSCPHAIEHLGRSGLSLCLVGEPAMVEPWLILSGPIGGPPPGTESFFVQSGDDILPDAFDDELFAMVRAGDGWVVVTGCCHKGLANTLRKARFLAHGQPIRAIVGGLHLRKAHRGRIEEVVEMLDTYGRPHLYPCHCTGPAATAYLEELIDDRVHPVRGGDRIWFDRGQVQSGSALR